MLAAVEGLRSGQDLDPELLTVGFNCTVAELRPLSFQVFYAGANALVISNKLVGWYRRD